MRLPSFLLLALAGCSIKVDPPPAVDVATSELTPHFSAVSDDRTLHLVASFDANGDGDVRLPQGDRVVARLENGTEVELEQKNEYKTTYERDVPAIDAERRITFELRRPPGKTSAGARVVVPAAFRVIDPPETVPSGGPLSFGLSGYAREEVTITANAAAGLVKGCLRGVSGATVRVQAERVSTSNLSLDLVAEATSCPTTFDVSTENIGEVDAAFRDRDPIGKTYGSQKRTFSATVVR